MKPVDGARWPPVHGRRIAHRCLALAGALALTAALSGCLESADTIRFQPGVYQGAPDPLVSDAAVLESRFQGQTDR